MVKIRSCFKTMSVFILNFQQQVMLTVLYQASDLGQNLYTTHLLRIRKDDAIMKNNTNIQYRQVGDFNIPNLILPPEEANIKLGKWGMLHKDYLLKNRRCYLQHYLLKANFISTVQRFKIRQSRCLILLLNK